MARQTKILIACTLGVLGYIALAIAGAIFMGNQYHSGVGWLVFFILSLPCAGLGAR